MQLSFQDRTYLVTGGGSGIGKGVAAGLVAAGAAVMIVGRNPDKLAAAVKDIEALKTGAIGYEPADITDEEQTLRVVDAATAWHGRLHGVVHCAGGSQTIGPITQIDSQAWRRTVDLNVNGTMYVLKHAARELVRGGGGSFVGISSIAASNTHRWFGAYGVTKSAVDHMMKLAADELGPSWVRVNSIRPKGPGLLAHAGAGVRRRRAAWSGRITYLVHAGHAAAIDGRPLVRCRVGGGAAAVQRICAGFGGRRGGGGLVGCR